MGVNNKVPTMQIQPTIPNLESRISGIEKKILDIVNQLKTAPVSKHVDLQAQLTNLFTVKRNIDRQLDALRTGKVRYEEDDYDGVYSSYEISKRYMEAYNNTDK